MKNRILTTTLLIVGLVFSAQLLMAQPEQRPMNQGQGMTQGRGMAALHTELNLSDEQESQMQSLRLAHEKKMIGLRADLETERLAMRELELADTPNKKKLYAQIEKISEMQVRIQKANLEHRLAVADILTPEQLKIFKRSHMKGTRGNHGRQNDCDSRGGRGQGKGRF